MVLRNRMEDDPEIQWPVLLPTPITATISCKSGGEADLGCSKNLAFIQRDKACQPFLFVKPQGGSQMRQIRGARCGEHRHGCGAHKSKVKSRKWKDSILGISRTHTFL